MAAEPVKSTLPDFFRNDLNAASLLAYPFQLLLFQAIGTPLERFQVLRQCAPSLTLHRNRIGPQEILHNPAILSAAPDASFGYSGLLKS